METAHSTAAAGESREAEWPQSFIRIARVKEISGLSKSTLIRWIKAKRFPAPVIVEDPNVRLWDLAEVMAWRASQFQKREQRERGNNDKAS